MEHTRLSGLFISIADHAGNGGGLVTLPPEEKNGFARGVVGSSRSKKWKRVIQ